MAYYPSLVVGLINLLFAVSVLRQYMSSRKNSHFFWFLSLVFSTAASFSYFTTMVSTPKSAGAFAMYYLLGALWMPSIMGLGSLSLLYKHRTLLVCTSLVSVTGLVGTVLLLLTPQNNSALQALDGGAGVDVYQPGVWLAPLITLNSFGAISVLWVAVVSAWRTVKKRAPRRFLYGNIWLSVGVLTISLAGSAARLGVPSMFWITMLVGWMLTYIGYRLLTLFVSPQPLPVPCPE